MSADRDDPLATFVGERVVIDTAGPMIYIGTLSACAPAGLWLLDADVHDRSDGHSTKEEYVSRACELERSGTRRTNRRRVLVERRHVLSASRLADVVTDDEPADGGEARR